MEQPIKNLGAAMLLQATKDYLKASPARQRVILEDLKGDWCNFLTDGMAGKVATQLAKNPSAIDKRMKRLTKLHIKGVRRCNIQ